MASDPLFPFLLPVRAWFQAALGEPTPAQRQGWPAIAAGRHTLILAPTGSGKTLAAFLACLDALWRQDPLPRGVQVLYISPLKALNNDIHRNLQAPLEGVADLARKMGLPLPTIEAAVRTGDTPQAERQKLVRKPPHVLITTPESLHLLLTSQARETLRGVRYCIVDEIHALCPNKRGVFLSLLLERLEAIQESGVRGPRSGVGSQEPSAGRFVRIGLSATQRPLEEVARFLGGAQGPPPLGLREVAIVDAGVRRDLDLKVVSPVEHFTAIPERTVWPAIYRLLDREIRRHRSTIVFANNRRTVERITAQLNEAPGARSQESEIGDQESGQLSALDSSLSALHARAHHGSISLEVRQQTEQALKEGRLAAVVATASLELGIDMGAVDLVCQVEAPGSVARGLQRVGRAGHVVGQQSKGRLIPKTSADLLEQAVLAHAMAAGQVEAIHVPTNCLDVLAQQVVAMTAMEPWNVTDLFNLVRRAYSYQNLTAQAFESVLEMVCGRFAAGAGNAAQQRTGLTALQPRISWDRVHNRLHALPGSQQLALTSGGAIPDTGQYAAFTRGGVRIGELDEEFVYERRLGDTFMLGSNAWRIDRIEADRVVVEPAEGMPALVPFWRGETAGRSTGLGEAIGQFLRELKGRHDDADCIDWLQREYFLDPWAARNLVSYVRRQLAASDDLPTDRTLMVEACRDPLGDWQVILLSPLGHRLHLGLRFAIEARLHQLLGYRPRCLHDDNGLLIRQADAPEPFTDLFDGLTPDNVESLIVAELADSPLFALRFRQNAARSLLMPRHRPGQRAPLWLQRIRGRDLLQVARQSPDFPVVIETFREILQDYLDVPRLKQLLADIQSGVVQVRQRRADAPSPFAAGMLFNYTAANMYELDHAEPGTPSARLDDQLLRQLTGGEQIIDERAVQQVDRRLRSVGKPPRSLAEMAEWLRRVGDASQAELEGPMAAFLQELAGEGRVSRIQLPAMGERWVLAEEKSLYDTAFGATAAPPAEQRAAAESILQRFLGTHALVGLSDILDRYPFDAAWARQQLEAWASAGRVVAIAPAEQSPQYAVPENLEQVQRGTLATLRREVVSCPPTQFADFLLQWQHLQSGAAVGLEESAHPAAQLDRVLDRLEGLLLPVEVWEGVVLPGRLKGYQARWLDDLIATGAWSWMGAAADGAAACGFHRREHLPLLIGPDPFSAEPIAQRVLEHLRARGASFVVDVAAALELPPSAVRSGLWQLLRQRLASNDGFDVVRRGPPQEPPPGRRSLRAPLHAEGRWSLIPWGRPTAEEHALFQAQVLLRRYGIAARELALLDPGLPPWRILYEVLSQLEMKGEVRRGYFVEGLSGAQFALPEAMRQLQDAALPSTSAAPLVLLHSLDPANVYGSGAPLDIPLLDGGTRPLLRRPGNWLVLKAGRPVLIVEQHGKRLTALPSASRDDVAAAVARLPAILSADRGLAGKKKLSVAEWNGQPIAAGNGREFLESAGFVRDLQEMTLYAGVSG